MAKEIWHLCPVLFHTVELVRGWIEQNRFLPKICPCCERKVKRYKNPLLSGYCVALIALVALFKNEEGWYHVSQHVLRVKPTYHDLGKCRHFGLAEQCPNEDDPTKNYSGLWRPTELGIAFVEGTATIPNYEVRENRKVLWLEGGDVDIRHCLGESFDYEKLMKDYDLG